MDRAMMAKQLTDLLNLRSMPVGIAFPETPPDGVARVESAGPSGCTYWKYAAEGRTFYTTAEDHFNCPIGAYTHNVELPNDRKQELQDVLGVMFSLEYVREEEVPGIPRRESDFHVAVYGPLADSSFKPEIVLICGNAKQLMILSEAANAAGVGESTNFMGRPTCAAIPQAMNTQAGVVNLGCIGNRVYTGMADEELYFALPVEFLPAVVDKLETIVNANRELAKYHQSRLETIGQS